MAKKIVISLAVLVLACVCVFGAGRLVEPQSGIHALEEWTLCPVAGCGGICHDYDNVPQPDGLLEMICPEAGCSSVECHAWDTLQGRYKQASDASMNLWILAPVVLVIALVVLVGALSKPERQEGSGVVEATKPDGEEMSKEADA